MLAGIDSRQLSEMYAFARVEPLDEPLARMIAQLTDVLARVNGNETSAEDFMLVKKPEVDDPKARSVQIAALFQSAASQNRD